MNNLPFAICLMLIFITLVSVLRIWSLVSQKKHLKKLKQIADYKELIKEDYSKKLANAQEILKQQKHDS